ncbi:MAG: IGHMBP2 family helicase [Thermotogaceae bacterium]|nr:IGHMBP2 family helicase [Thermotogaceae bacterium]
MNYFEKLLQAIELEREEEKKAAINEIKALPGSKREKLGRAILNLKGSYKGRELGGLYLVKFGRKTPFENTEIDVGDVVLASKGNPLKSDLTGTVTSRTSRSITVAFSDPPPKWVLSKGIRIDLYYNDITFKRMEEAVNVIKDSESFKWLREILLGKRRPSFPEKINLSFFDEKLNDFQKEAVSLSLGSKEVFLIHGPPGTGKTRTLIEVINQLVKAGKKVAVAADSNAAVDNILSRMKPECITRIGHPARVEKNLIERTLSYKVENSARYKEVENYRKLAEDAIKERDKCTKPEPKYKRGLSDEQILQLAKQGRSSRGIPSSIIKSMASWIEKNTIVQIYLDKAKEIEEEIIKEILGKSCVVIGTASSFGIDYMKDFSFDVLVFDEATQATEPAVYIPLILSKTMIMAGDHKQLPPTILNEKAKEILSKTLFERLIEKYPENSRMLRIQYRMNEKIMEFPSETFYDGKLIADESVGERTLESVGYTLDEIDDNFLKEVLDPKKPLVLIDTSNHPGKQERQRKGSTSYENQLEASIASKVLKGLLKMKIPKEEIGIITPYDDQVELISREISEVVKVSSVDGFQGQEREVIIISFVRSNKNGEIGFLNDLRRLNVSITRARSKLIMIGDFKTLSHHPVYKELRDFVKIKGHIVIYKSD